MQQQETDIVVLGCGAAGAAIACVLTRLKRFAITVAYRHEQQGSSFSNQKWKHSGALYPNRELAREAWNAYSAMNRYNENRYIVGPQNAYFLSDSDAVRCQLQDQWNEWDVDSWGLRIEPVSLPPSSKIGSFGPTCLIGGFRTPDCVLDFFGDPKRDSFSHGVKGLTIVFPGKASFMWTVAEQVVAQVTSALGRLI